jgi:metal-responsive CopG/Arc/MetJ family transcriptional regulator
MRKDRISVALTKDLIAKLNLESKKARRSRSDFMQLILEEYFAKEGRGEEPASQVRMLSPAPSLRKSW